MNIRALTETAKGLGDELAQRIDDLQEEGHMDAHAAESMGGIIEGLSSLEDALSALEQSPAKGPRTTDGT